MGAVGVAKRRATEGGGSMKTFGRGAFGLGSALVVVSCAGASACSMGAPGDDSPTASAPALGAVTLPVVAASALPQGLGARLGKKCGSALPAAASAVLFGPNAAPPKLSELRRVIPEPTGGKARPFEIVGGRIPIKEARASAARETVGTHANEPAVLTSADGKMTVGSRFAERAARPRWRRMATSCTRAGSRAPISSSVRRATARKTGSCSHPHPPCRASSTTWRSRRGWRPCG